VERAFFVGTSQGGFLSLRAALLAPERVRAIAAIGSSATAETPEKRAAYTQMHDVFMASGAAGPPAELLGHLCPALPGLASRRRVMETYLARVAARTIRISLPRPHPTR
jgi:pimeloyl-ACP methyl ester carboxylesterase